MFAAAPEYFIDLKTKLSFSISLIIGDSERNVSIIKRTNNRFKINLSPSVMLLEIMLKKIKQKNTVKYWLKVTIAAALFKLKYIDNNAHIRKSPYKTSAFFLNKNLMLIIKLFLEAT